MPTASNCYLLLPVSTVLYCFSLLTGKVPCPLSRDVKRCEEFCHEAMTKQRWIRRALSNVTSRSRHLNLCRGMTSSNLKQYLKQSFVCWKTCFVNILNSRAWLGPPTPAKTSANTPAIAALSWAKTMKGFGNTGHGDPGILKYFIPHWPWPDSVPCISYLA